MKEKKKIGVLVAIEIDSVLHNYGEPCERETLCGFQVMHYENEAFIMYVLNAGAGELAAAAGTQLLIARYDVDMVVNFGVVGALTEEMAKAERCIVTRLIHYDFSGRSWLGLPDGQYPGRGTLYYETTPELVEKALALDPGLKAVTCASADKFVDTLEDKRQLHERFGAEICEMEAAGVVITAERCGVPSLVIKAVSDGLSGGAEEFFEELKRVSDLCFETVDKLLRAGI